MFKAEGAHPTGPDHRMDHRRWLNGATAAEKGYRSRENGNDFLEDKARIRFSVVLARVSVLLVIGVVGAIVGLADLNGADVEFRQQPNHDCVRQPDEQNAIYIRHEGMKKRFHNFGSFSGEWMSKNREKPAP